MHHFSKTIFALLAVAIALLPKAGAQNDTSRYEHYRQQYTKLHNEYLRAPNDVANIAAFAYFYSEPDNPMKNLPLAMDYIQVSETRYRNMIGDKGRYRDVNRLIKKGFTIVELRQRRQMIIDEARKYVKQGVQPDEIDAFMHAFANDKMILREISQQKSIHAYNQTIALNSERAYKEYLDNPNYTYKRDSAVNNLKELLKARINSATTTQTIDQITNEFDYPEIKAIAEKRKCEIDYSNAILTNTAENYINFLRRYPSSDKYKLVLAALDSLAVEEFYKLQTPRQFADFALKFNDLEISEQAVDTLVKMIVEQQNNDALHIYLNEFKLDQHYNDVYKAYYLRYSYEGNLDPILMFEQQNPNFPLKFLIEEDKKTATEIDKLPLLEPFSDATAAKEPDLLKMYMGKGINFVILQRLLQPYTTKNNWKGALSFMTKYEICFDNKQNPAYQELKKILSENVKTKTTNVYSPRYNVSHPQITSDGSIFFNKHTNLRTQIVQLTQQKQQSETEVPFDTLDNSSDITFFSLSHDGKTMLVGQKGDIYAAVRQNGVWKLQDLEAEGLNTVLHYEGDATLTPDGMGLLFVSDRPNGYNVNQSGSLFHGDTALASDIYFLPRTSNGWGQPINLGPIVNSPCSERSPVLSKDLTTLYFTSDRNGGMGFYDIYMCTRKNINSWTEWNTPENIGKAANTSFSEPTISLSPNEETILYTSNSPAMKRYAIYSTKTKHLKGSSFYRTATINCKNMNFLSNMLIEVVDIQSNVTIHQYKLSDTVSSFKFDIFAKKDYFISCSSNGYFIPLQIAGQNSAAIEPKAYHINSCVANRTHITTPTITFADSSALLLPQSQFEIQRLATLLINNPKLKIEIVSNVDADDVKLAYDLSQQRSNFIKKALAALNIPADRILASGYGNTNYKKRNGVPPIEIILFQE